MSAPVTAAWLLGSVPVLVLVVPLRALRWAFWLAEEALVRLVSRAGLGRSGG